MRRQNIVPILFFTCTCISVRDNWEKVTDFTDSTYPVSTGGKILWSLLTNRNPYTCPLNIYIYPANVFVLSTYENKKFNERNFHVLTICTCIESTMLMMNVVKKLDSEVQPNQTSGGSGGVDVVCTHLKSSFLSVCACNFVSIETLNFICPSVCH